MKGLCLLPVFAGLASAQFGAHCLHVRNSIGKVEYACEREGRSEQLKST